MNTWIETYTGAAVNPFHFSVDDVNIVDIAHSLSLTCRFGGHCNQFYSVAEHSIRCVDAMAELKPTFYNEFPYFLMFALLHDAAEAYFVDIPAPIKPHIPFVKDIERNIDEAVRKKFKLDHEALFLTPYIDVLDIEADVKKVDQIILATEARDLGMNRDGKWSLNFSPLERTIVPMTSNDAKRAFLDLFYDFEEMLLKYIANYNSFCSS